MPKSKLKDSQLNDIKLWYAYIGGTDPGKKIESHDVIFGFGVKAEDIYPLAEKSWSGIKSSVHIDCIGPLLSADGYNITLDTQPQQSCDSYFVQQSSDEQLQAAVGSLEKAYVYVQKENQLGWLYVEKGEILKSFEALKEKTANQTIAHLIAHFKQKDGISQQQKGGLIALLSEDLNLIQTVTGHAPAYKSKPFFVNLGGYLPGVFAEVHENVIVIAPDELEAKNRALKAIAQLNFKSAHRDFIHDVQYDADQLTDLTKLLSAQSSTLYVHLHPTDNPHPFEYMCKYTPIARSKEPAPSPSKEPAPSSKPSNTSWNPLSILEHPAAPSYKTSLTASFAFGALGLLSYINGNTVEASASFIASAVAAKISLAQAGFNGAHVRKAFTFFKQVSLENHQEQQSSTALDVSKT